MLYFKNTATLTNYPEQAYHPVLSLCALRFALDIKLFLIGISGISIFPIIFIYFISIFRIIFFFILFYRSLKINLMEEFILYKQIINILKSILFINLEEYRYCCIVSIQPLLSNIELLLVLLCIKWLLVDHPLNIKIF